MSENIIHTKFTRDDILAEQVMQSTQMHYPEMQAKNIIYTEDLNDSYTNNICTFQLQSLANSNMTVDIKNSHIILPMLGHLVTTKAISMEQARQSMILKSDCSVVHNIEVELSNHMTQEPINNISMYKAFIDHSTGSVLKDEWNSGLKIYHKMTGDAWFYDAEGGIRQDKVSDYINENKRGSGFLIYNKGVKSNLNYEDPLKTPIINAGSMSRYGEPRLEKISGTEYYYHHYAVIRLGDISSFCEQLSLITGPYFQLKIRLNQVTGYKLNVTNNSVKVLSQNMANDFVPFFRASTESEGYAEYELNGDFGSVNGSTDYTYKLMLGHIGTKLHDMSRPRWVMDSYQLSEQLESSILSNPVRNLNYLELIHSQHMGVKNYFSLNLASSARDIERLIVIPVLSKNSNGSHSGGVQVNANCSVTHGLNTSPININNLKLSVSGKPIYIQPLSYNYEHYLQQMDNSFGNKAKNGSISLKDFSNLYHYIVFDLTRVAVTDIGSKASYELSGSIDKIDNDTSLEYDFYIFFEQRRNVSVDLVVGHIL